ncbi:MAG TPA: M20/M25/M40 family metallo-hydrolase [Thermomonas sp.]|nr:M20/M25/M40 family metallo-hydrolase [Thermomonas sp.]
MKHVLLAAALLAAGAASAQEKVDLAMTGKIRAEAFNRSQVMATLGELTEQVGPRLTNSPGMARANAWARGKFAGWGLANVHDESIGTFGRGWEFSDASAVMLSPRGFPLHVLPKAWTPATPGPVEGEAVLAKLESKGDLDKWRGKLRGKVLLVSDPRDYKFGDKPDMSRYSEEELHELLAVEVPKDRNGGERAAMLQRYKERIAFGPVLNRFLAEEGVLATVSISSRDNGILVLGGGGSRMAGEPVGVPALVMAAEQYNMLARTLKQDQPVRLRVNVAARFTDEADQPGYNTIAEIPGTGPHRDEVVMLGAHMDSWHAGTGASDNGAGVAVAMEAVRILKAIGAKPDRTIRVALWSGEEQGLIGSAAYVADHFAHYPEPTDPEEKAIPAFFRENKGALVRGKDYGKLAAYFNLDNGSGRIRGIYAQENMAAAPIFQDWLKPWNDVGATIVTQRNTGSTDHISFDRVGLPGFQFVQDGLDYFSNVHHTDLDTYDHASAEDLKQASAIMASFVYNAAMRPSMLPRKPLAD